MIVTDPSAFRFSVTGNVLDISRPKAEWEIFKPRSASGSAPVRLNFLFALPWINGLTGGGTRSDPVGGGDVERIGEEALEEGMLARLGSGM